MKLKMNVMLYVFSCTLYDTLRNNFFDETINKYYFFNDLDVKSKICSYLTILIHLFVNHASCYFYFWDYES